MEADFFWTVINTPQLTVKINSAASNWPYTKISAWSENFYFFSDFFLDLFSVRFWEFSQKAQIFLKFASPTNYNLLSKNLALDLLSQAIIIFYELSFSNFKETDIVQ